MTEFRGILTFVFATPLLVAAMGRTPASIDVVPAAPIAEELIALPLSNVTYYSNALHTTIVGRFGYDCCNNAVAWGKKSQFATTGGCFPCFPPPI